MNFCLTWLQYVWNWLVTHCQSDPKSAIIVGLCVILAAIALRAILKARANRMFFEAFGFVPNAIESKAQQGQVYQVIGTAGKQFDQLVDESEAIKEQLRRKLREVNLASRQLRRLSQMAKARGFAIEPQ